MSDRTARQAQLEDAIRSNILELYSNLPHIADIREFAMAREQIHNIVDRAIQPVAREFNKRCPMHALPTELFQKIVSWLSPREVYCAALVCQDWRTELLRCPFLWTRVSIYQRNTSDVDAQALTDLFTLLLSRSGDLPLTVEYEYCGLGHRNWNNTYGHVATVLIPQMHRITSLSLVLPHVDGTDFEKLLMTPAPMLECFRLHVVAANVLLRYDFFPGATRLRDVSLRGVYFPQWAYVALRSVTHLMYDAGEIDDVDLDQIATLFPELRSLTILFVRCLIERAHMCPQPLALRVPNVRNIQRVFEAFPNAVSICLDASVEQRDPAAFHRLLVASRPPTSLELSIGTSDYAPELLVILDGVVVAVDPRFQDLASAFDQISPTFYASLRNLSVSRDYLVLFSAAPLPELDTLTIVISVFDNWQSQIAQTPVKTPVRVSILRLVHRLDADAIRVGAEDMSATDILYLARAVVDTPALHRVVLCGPGFAPDCSSPPELDAGLDCLRHVEVTFEPSPPRTVLEACKWELPTDDAINIAT